MSRSQGAGLARHAVDASHAGAARKEREARRGPNAGDVVTPAPMSNQALGQALGTGAPLDPVVRAEMETRFGADFGAVRVHDEPSAHGLAQHHLAQAFTVGNHIAFNKDRYSPGRTDGKHLLAHELAHVVQQRRGGTELPSPGGPLEQAAERASAQLVSGSGPVAVAGAGAVAVARQPLPEDELPPPPRSLSESVAKNEKDLSDTALDLEMRRIEDYAGVLPMVPEREHLLSEYKLMFDERVARRKRKESPIPLPYRPNDVKRDIEDAYRAFVLTGQVPQTQYPHSLVEIKLGKPMSRRERYDLMMKLQGREHPLEMDVRQDLRDPEILGKEEFEQEYRSRIAAEKDACDDEYFWPKYERQCKEGVNEKYGGPAYVQWRDDNYRRAYAQLVQVSEKIDAVKSGGPVSLLGRVAGYGFGAATGRDPLKTSEDWATVASLGDAYLAYRGMRTERSRMQSYSASGGLEVRRDADIQLIQPRASGMSPTPPQPIPSQLTPGAPTGQSTLAPPFSSVSPGSPGLLPANPATQAGLGSSPIPISSGKGLPQSNASKALASNLAKQSPAKAGSISPLPARKPGTVPPTSQPAQQDIPAVEAVENKIAVGQTHGPDVAAKPAAKPALSAIQGGKQPTVASLKKPAAKPGVTSSQPAASTTTASKAQTRPGVKSPAATGGAKAASTTAKVGTQAPAAKVAGQVASKVPASKAAGVAAKADPQVAVRFQGGGSKRKGTYWEEGSPGFQAAQGNKKFSIMPKSQAEALDARPYGTPYDPTIKPAMRNGVQLESNGAGTGKANRHNISARVEPQDDPKARPAAFDKTIGASLREATGYKYLLYTNNERGVLRPGNASTGGVDGITADATAGQGKVYLNDFTGLQTGKGEKASHKDWVGELGTAVKDPRFGFNDKAVDETILTAVSKGEVYVRTVRVDGPNVTVQPGVRIAVPKALRNAAAKVLEARKTK